MLGLCGYRADCSIYINSYNKYKDLHWREVPTALQGRLMVSLGASLIRIFSNALGNRGVSPMFDENTLFPWESRRVNTIKFEYLPARQEKNQGAVKPHLQK